MPAYEYTALNRRGREETGVLEADTPRLIRQQLREKQLIPLDVQEVSDAPKRTALRTSRRGLNSADLALFTRQLATLIRAATPLEESLATISRQTHKKSVQRIVLGVRARLVEGYTLADSLAQFPGVFPGLYRATVAAGEQAGHLDDVLDRLADYTEEHQAIQQKITTALVYPVMLTLVSIAVVAGLLGYVVPQVVQIFDSLDQELPFLTRLMIFLSDIVKTTGPYVLIATVVGLILFFRLYKSNTGFHRRTDRFLLRLPLFGDLIRGKHTAAFSRTLSILAASGVPILTAMMHAAEVVGNIPMREAINDAAERVREGASISGSLQKSGLFPPMTLHLIASGEASGNLEAMLERAATQQERETTNRVNTMVTLFEPILILVMGAVVLVIVLAILLPIFDLNQLIQQ
ncbi:MAG TPA: type II secretion system protein GspF [Chromatiales bacterium]|nr:type II secretion system protein GspF [Thiotrichales bacterium]HIP67042.1 type II secretion system protein GspF [Chromatiales bacterium]